ncbi:hypothetical protein M1M25_gp046 [Tenacibaculum phage Gundel_1]|uniref:YopX protein domain-containing protein n=1 Tax=Tenacibaculum phage Gundel_1 TaxID=2745672 RepID=A0A8E5EBL2_9CAUD|nr:hypothetical protein M1M25_gp046 [Tenacibaculum phage Gundel_1]QQV91479.1 hypothetical protein Gundel1_46 [Tenacibaculum phage Gundel_1]
MKREILYKGETVGSKKLVEGYIMPCYENNQFKISYWEDILVDGETNTYEPVIFSYEVIPETVSQFIRLDSDKKRVFEGDILDEEYTAKWSNEKCGFYLESKFGSDHNKPMSFIDENNLKVTGNIHD